MNLIKIYVISLKDIYKYIKSENYKNLKKITSSIVLSRGIIPSDKVCIKYSMYPKSNIGCTFAHLKVWKKIKKVNNKNNNLQIKDFSLILEDDTFLNIEYIDFEKTIKDIINLYGNKFDIYKLHSDFNNGFSSMAAYLVNNNKINYMIKNYKIILGHIDFDLYVQKLLGKYIILTHSFNIFRTDENTSTNRKEKYLTLDLFNNIYLTKRSDKNLKHLVSYKVFKLFNYEFIAYEIFLFLILIISILFKNKKLFIIIIIILLV